MVVPESGIQVTSHSRILIPKLLIPNPQSLVTSHQSLKNPIPERIAIKTPLLQSGVIAAGANWNPRYHPVFITHEARGYEKKSYKKRPYFLSEIGATCAVPPYIILCAYIRNVDRRLGLLRSTKGLTGDSQYWNAPACTIRRLSVPWTNIFLVPIIACHACNAGGVENYLVHFRNSRVSLYPASY